MLYIAIGILGATVMPHNLYLHSAIAQRRSFDRSNRGKREAIRFGTIDTASALMAAFFINAAILMIAAAFHRAGYTEVSEIQDAYQLLAPVLGSAMACILFGIALLVAGHMSAVTGTLAGQIIMEGFLRRQIPPVVRRLVTRALALVPAVGVSLAFGQNGTAQLLVFSQVVLSLQLSFAVVPLIIFTSDRSLMGDFANPRWVQGAGGSAAIGIAVVNSWLIWQTLT